MRMTLEGAALAGIALLACGSAHADDSSGNRAQAARTGDGNVQGRRQRVDADAVRETRKQVVDRWEKSEARRRLRALDEVLCLLHQRVRLLHLQTAVIS